MHYQRNRKIGSPPLTRGLLVCDEEWESADGITPAHAGTTSNHHRSQRHTEDHPRSRGDYAESDTSFQSGTGITPAHAGTTQTCDGWKRHDRDHPRSRGDYRLLEKLLVPKVGSPPLTRGLQSYRCRNIVRNRITPAHAGTTDTRHDRWYRWRDHPRSRGDYASATVK